MDRRKKNPPSGPRLKYITPYPKRPPFFFAHAMRVMSHAAVAQEVGLLGYAILMEIVLTEDRRGYRSPPEFWQTSFQDRFDRGKDAVSEAIKRCVKSGWLHWDQPAHRQKAIAWIIIPESVDQSGVNRDWAEFPTNHPANYPTNHPANYPTNHPAPSTLPKPIPSPFWAEAEAEVRRAGVTDWRRAVSDVRKHGLGPEDVQALVAWWQEHRSEFSRPSGALYFALRGAGPEHRGDWGKAFPRKPEAAQQPLQAPGQQSAAAAASCAQGERLVQLLFDWEAEVKDLSVAEMVTKFELPAELTARLAPYQTWKQMDRAPDSLRIAVLSIVEQRLAS